MIAALLRPDRRARRYKEYERRPVLVLVPMGAAVHPGAVNPT
jgi:hypothetical protein